MRRFKNITILFLVFVLLLSGCSVGTDTRRSTSEKENKTENSFKGSLGGETTRVLSGSENQGLSDILKECAKKTGVSIEMTYKGSVDIMHELEEGAEDYDAVWPASSLWISLGDKQHLVKYNQSISGDFDAMVNYESLIIDANQQLTAEGKEPLYVVYPYDGLSLSDSLFGYVDHGDSGKQEAFQKVQEYLLSEPVQSEIEGTGRRTNISGISKEHKDVFNADWGIDTDRILSPHQHAFRKVLRKALNNYQTSFRKPSLNVYCLDYSGSMYGEGNSQLVEAMGQVLLQENARKNLLQASEGEVNIIITFDSEIKNIYTSESAEATDLEQLYQDFSGEEPDGGTDMYLAWNRGLR